MNTNGFIPPNYSINSIWEDKETVYYRAKGSLNPILLLFFIMSILSLFPLVIFLDDFTDGYGFLRSFISSIPAGLPLCSFIIYFIYRYYRTRHDIKCNHNLMMDFSNSEKYAKGKIGVVITYGAKTIATIVDIQYIRSDKQYVKKVASSTNSKSKRKSNNVVQFIVRNSPAFKVKYKFNPPDDYKSEDLVHEFIMHHEPENYLKIGDPLPILYRIERENEHKQCYIKLIKKRETVTSIPYPFVLDDVSHFQDVLYSSRNEFFRSRRDHDDVLGLSGRSW